MKQILLAYLCGGILVSGLVGCGEEPEPDVPEINSETLQLLDNQPPLFSTDPVAMLQRDERKDEFAESAAAESTDPMARTQYALDFAAGKVGAQNPEKVLEWLKTAADAGDVDAGKALNSYQLRYGNELERRQILPKIRKLAQSGDMESQLLMARCCLLGNAGEPRDEAQAANWFQMAAEQGDSTAQFSLGVYHQTGTFPIGDSAQLATELLREMNAPKSTNSTASRSDTKSADLAKNTEDTATAENTENTENTTGDSENTATTDTKPTTDTKKEPNSAEAAKWYRLAAEQGFAPAQVALGQMFLQGNGVERNPTEGVQWLQRAAENGDLGAQFFVGQCYLSGIGTSHNSATGAEWTRRAAEGGHAAAMETLGSLYQTGDGVTMDPTRAVEWFRRAADLGREHAAFLLGMCYQEGTGVSANPEESLRWFRTAANRGDRMAQNMLKILEEPKE